MDTLNKVVWVYQVIRDFKIGGGGKGVDGKSHFLYYWELPQKFNIFLGEGGNK